MPLYDFDCPKCGKVHTELLSFDKYDEFESAKCEDCGTEVTKDNRIISGNIKKVVLGVRKGHYNSGDFS